MATEGERWELRVGERGYPASLLELPEPPETLHGFGDPLILGDGLGVVGSRKATPYGLACTSQFAGWAASHGVTVVSGAAIGCDLAAHQAALAGEGPTVAVLPCGADVDYPASGAAVLAAIRERGAVISEAPWGSPPARWTFVRRNRIIAGLSRALLVAEAGLPSGTFTTADFALDLGREVLAVPGSIFAPECRGANRLIREGATPITDVSELAEALGRETLFDAEPAMSGDRVLSALRTSPMRPDDLARALAIDIVEVVRAICVLEVSGRIARYRDGRYGPVRG